MSHVSDSTVDEVVKLASSIKDTLDVLCDVYCQLPPIIEEEHQAIEIGKIEALQTAQQKKELISEQVEAHFGKMQGYLSRFLGMVPEYGESAGDGEKEGSEPLGMHAVLARLAFLADGLDAQSLKKDVLLHIAERLEKSVQAFEQKMREIHPLVEKNRYIVDRALRNYRESYCFWQNVVEEEQVPYDSKGTRKAKSQGSGFVTKA